VSSSSQPGQTEPCSAFRVIDGPDRSKSGDHAIGRRSNWTPRHSETFQFTCFQALENFLDNNFNNGGTIADMEGASGNYGQQVVLLPMYVQWANIHIATLRNSLWGPRE
jgi:hypothetical protein